MGLSRFDGLNYSVPPRDDMVVKVDGDDVAEIIFNEDDGQFELHVTCDHETYNGDEAYEFAKWMKWWFLPEEDE